MAIFEGVGFQGAPCMQVFEEILCNDDNNNNTANAAIPTVHALHCGCALLVTVAVANKINPLEVCLHN